MKYYLIAGEASGDLHGSNLAKSISECDSAAKLRGWGGDKMAAADVKVVKNYRDLAFMGFAEVVKNLPTIFRNLAFCKNDVTAFAPDVLVLIDYPGFNMRIAKWAKKQGLKVVWYISPQLWAWKENRVKALIRDVNEMLVILPFEKAFYARHGMKVTYTGHPLANVIDEWQRKHANIRKENRIALLPGSRQQEIKVKLPVMLQVAANFPDYVFTVAKAPGIADDFYESIFGEEKNVELVAGKTYDLLARSRAAVVTSGTATLETALLGVPEVVVYKGSNISYQIARRIIKIKFISLVNLIMDREVVKELIQNEMTAENISRELKRLLTDKVADEKIRADYKALRKVLSGQGDASLNAAKIIVQTAAGVNAAKA